MNKYFVVALLTGAVLVTGISASEKEDKKNLVHVDKESVKIDVQVDSKKLEEEAKKLKEKTKKEAKKFINKI